MSAYPGKRALDLVLITIALPVVLPVMALTALLVRLALGSPVFFRQQRPGLHGKPFEVIKFRTMTDARDPGGTLLPDERRLTRFGRFLRSSSLDELPELINVARGEMSLVGPRPLLMQYLPLYSARHARRHDVPPGLTGLTQVAGRNALGWPEKLDLDVEYAERCSLALDLRILARTLSAVLGRRGISAPGEATMPVFRGYADAAATRDTGAAAR